MAREVDVDELRHRLGIKKLKKRIRISEAERSMIRGLRERDARRAAHPEKLSA